MFITLIIVATIVFFMLIPYLTKREVKSAKASVTEASRASPSLSKEELELKIDKVRAVLKDSKLDTVRLKPINKKPRSVTSSKFGGNPYWPLTMDYPTDGTGQPLHLLAQLNFSELPKLEHYPESGLLQFFIANDDVYGYEFASPGQDPVDLATNPKNFRVIYHESMNSSELLTDFPVKDDDCYLPLNEEYAIEATLDNEVASVSDYRFERIDFGHTLDDDVMDYFYDHESALGSKIGGYAHFTQDDPRGYLAKEDWWLLFQMDTEYSEAVDIMWGDSGVGNFFIRPRDLKNKDFNKVWYNWDCC